MVDGIKSSGQNRKTRCWTRCQPGDFSVGRTACVWLVFHSVTLCLLLLCVFGQHIITPVALNSLRLDCGAAKFCETLSIIEFPVCVSAPSALPGIIQPCDVQNLEHLRVNSLTQRRWFSSSLLLFLLSKPKSRLSSKVNRCHLVISFRPLISIILTFSISNLN